MSPDDEVARESEASLSGTKKVNIKQEEVQLEEDGFEPQLEEMDDSEMEKMEEGEKYY